jgi:translation initiation factor 4E transporter
VPFGPGVVRPAPISASLPQNAPTEQEILEHMMAGGQPPRQPEPLAPKLPALPPALAQYLASCPLNTDLLARPEAEQLILGINSGNITLDNLLHQLSNPGLQQRQRDLLLSVLKLRTLGPDPRRGAAGPARSLPPPLAPHLAPAPQPAGGDPLQLPARVSPLMFPPGAGPAAHLSVSPAPQAARVPSPQEMTVLTQQIMQQALIKRKLEEQKENYRRRQGDEPGPGLAQVRRPHGLCLDAVNDAPPRRLRPTPPHSPSRRHRCCARLLPTGRTLTRGCRAWCRS